ncbi:MAG: hypothetical protein DRG11_03230 [Epsilonproteobacteria bacterium]|nr:MAG: hypothetical protein DRG11_03230 [Campylobacterota bacterium]
MKNLLKIFAAITLVWATNSFAHNVNKQCDVAKLGIDKVVGYAKVHNKEAKAKGVEFRRLNVNNTDLIKAVEDAVANGEKTVQPMHFKGKDKSKTKLDVNYAAQRACHFAITSLTQAKEAQKTYKLSIPGDGYKF